MHDTSNILIIIALLTFSLLSFGQEDSVIYSDDSILLHDTDSTYQLDIDKSEAVLIIPEGNTSIQIMEDDFKPDPIRAIWLGAVVPGYGQIINRKYWKLPIVYAGFLGCYYAVDYNAKQYISYKNAYLDIIDDDDNTNSFLDLIPDGYTIDSYGGKSSFSTLLKNGMDKSRYNRDLSVIITIAYYGLTLIDAFVDAHLFDYDISPDLSLKFRPSIIKEQNLNNQMARQHTAFGLSASFNF